MQKTMNNYKSLLLLCLAWCLVPLATTVLRAQTAGSVANELFKPPFEGKPEHVYTSYVDYSPLAARLTAGCADNYSKYKAIYEWICDSIDYDLSGSIHRADSCLLMRRGVCQAYCQLFYRIAEAAGLKVELIAGESRDADGRLMTGGHMWLFAYTRQDHGILLDPTWGAGYFLEQRYQKNPDKWSWFAVEPEWMLLTHYPDHEHYQLTGRHLSRDEFLALPAVNVLYRTYGIDTHRLFQMALDHHLTLPFFYNKGEGLFQLLDIPLQQSLRIGETYTFRVKMNSPLNFAILNQPLLCQKEHWKAEGAGVYSIKFMPRATGRVLFSLKDPDHTTRWNSMVEYRVETPTADDWAKVEQVYPLSVPDAVAAGPIDAEGWQRCGIDGHRLLACIREQHVKELPLLYYDKGQKFDIISIPMNRHLQAGRPYTFSIRPRSGSRWALVANRKQWHTEWKVDNQEVHTLTVTPDRKGQLELYVEMEDDLFWTCLSYVVD